MVYCKAPFAGPKQVLRYLSRYTHRVAISNRRLIAADDAGVAFRWKDYRANGPARWKTMRLHPHEFIRRFLLHVVEVGTKCQILTTSRGLNCWRGPRPRIPGHEVIGVVDAIGEGVHGWSVGARAGVGWFGVSGYFRP